MNKKKLLSLSVLGLGAVMALAGCDNKGGSSASESSSSSQAHVHTAGTEWKHDEKNHWHLCTSCGEKMDVAAHSFEEVVVAPTDDEQGYTKHVCACGYTYNDTYVDKQYEITFEGGDYSFVSGLPGKSKAGEKIEFKVTLESGYEAYSVTASYGEGETATAIELTGSLREGFSFTMPKGDVTIKAETRGAYFEVGPEDETKKVFTPAYQYASARTVKNFISGYIVDDKIVEGETTIYARAGSTVHLLRNFVPNADEIVYTVDGTVLEESQYSITTQVTEKDKDGNETTKDVVHTYNTIDFVMPAHSANVEVSAVERKFKFDIEAPDYVTWTLYAKDNDGNKTDLGDSALGIKDGIYGGTGTVYIDVALDPKDSEHNNGDYKINNVLCEYETRSGYEDKKGTVTSSSAKSVETGKTYSYAPTTYTSYYGNIKFKVEVLEATYKGASWIGTYGGAEFYGSSTGSSYTATADAFGQIQIVIEGGSKPLTYSIIADDEAGKLSINSSTTATEASTYAFYDGDVLFVNYYSTKLTDFSDSYLFIKGKTKSELTFEKSEGGKMYNTDAIYVVAKDSDGNEVGNFLKACNDIYLNVTVENEDGTTEGVSVNKESNFVVKKNGTKVGHYGVTDGEFGKIED